MNVFRKLPWKLMLQILKVFIITAQLWIFAGSISMIGLFSISHYYHHVHSIEYRYAHVNYYTNQQVALDHIFIQ